MGAVACDSKVPLASIHVFCAPVGPDDAAARRGGRSYGALPGESAKEYRWRSDAEEWRAVARDGLGGRYCSCARSCRPLDANGQAALQAELRLIAVRLDEAAQSRQLGIEARIESVAEAAPRGAERPREGAESTSGGGTQTAATIAGVVALLTATAGLVAALAGMFTALATWIKARRQPASTDTSASA